MYWNHICINVKWPYWFPSMSIYLLFPF
jgi:hypothetical protein